jgi:hypothetical protein
VCNKTFGLRRTLIAHQRIHTEGPYVCDVCNRVFRKKGNLINHTRKH